MPSRPCPFGGGLCALVLLALAVSVPAAAQDPPPGGGYKLEIVEQRVTLHAVSTSRITILRDLGKRLDFEVVADAAQDGPVTVRFEALPADQAIRRIMGKAGYLEVTDLEGRTTRLILTSSSVRLSRAAEKPYEPLAPPEIEPPHAGQASEPQPEAAPEGSAESGDEASAAQDSESEGAHDSRRLRRRTDRKRDDGGN